MQHERTPLRPLSPWITDMLLAALWVPEVITSIGVEVSWENMLQGNLSHLLLRNQKAPDFKHKDSGKALWLGDAPAWALSSLPPLKPKTIDVDMKKGMGVVVISAEKFKSDATSTRSPLQTTNFQAKVIRGMKL